MFLQAFESVCKASRTNKQILIHFGTQLQTIFPSCLICIKFYLFFYLLWGAHFISVGSITLLIVYNNLPESELEGKLWHFCVIQVKSQDKLKLTSYNFSNKHWVLTEEASEISIRTLKAVISGSISIVQNYVRILFSSEKMKLHCQENTVNTEQTDLVSCFPNWDLGF